MAKLLHRKNVGKCILALSPFIILLVGLLLVACSSSSSSSAKGACTFGSGRYCASTVTKQWCDKYDDGRFYEGKTCSDLGYGSS